MAFRKSVFVLGLICALDAAAVAQQPLAQTAGSTEAQVGDIVVTMDRCTLQNGQAVVNLAKGARLRVVALNGDWVGCSVLVNGSEEKGWIKKWLVAKATEGGWKPDNSDDRAVGAGKKITFDYTLIVDNCTVETSVGKSPSTYFVGHHNIIQGLETQMNGMRLNEEKVINVAAKDAYGQVDPKLIKTFAIGMLPKGVTPTAGMILQAAAPDGSKHPAVISEVKGDQVVLNFNHPLAGRDLTFNVRILKIENAPAGIPLATTTAMASGSHLTLRLDMTSGHPKVYVSRVDLEAALGKTLPGDNGVSPTDAIPFLVCSQNPPDATGKLYGKQFAIIPPANDKPGSGYLLVFDSAKQEQLGRCAYVAVTLSVYGASAQHNSDTILVRMPK